MKLHFQRVAIAVAFMVLLACAPVAAEEPPNDWPDVPETENIVPHQILSPDMFSDMSYTITNSLKAISNQGLRFFFIIGGVLLVSNIFLGMTAHQKQLNQAVERKEFNRETETEDMERNRTEIIRSKMRQKEIDLIANARFRATNHEMLVEDGVHKAELGHTITERIRELHADWEMNEGIRQAELNNALSEKLREMHPNWDVDVGIYRNEVSHIVNAAIRKMHPDWEINEGVRQAEFNHTITERIRELHPDWEFDEAMHRKQVSDFVNRRWDETPSYQRERQYNQFNKEYYARRNKE